MELEYSDRRLDMILGFCALFAFWISGVLVCLMGYVYIGGGLLTAAGIGTVVGTFVNGRLPVSRRKEAKPKEGGKAKGEGRTSNSEALST